MNTQIRTIPTIGCIGPCGAPLKELGARFCMTSFHLCMLSYFEVQQPLSFLQQAGQLITGRLISLNSIGVALDSRAVERGKFFYLCYSLHAFQDAHRFFKFFLVNCNGKLMIDFGFCSGLTPSSCLVVYFALFLFTKVQRCIVEEGLKCHLLPHQGLISPLSFWSSYLLPSIDDE